MRRIKYPSPTEARSEQSSTLYESAEQSLSNPIFMLMHKLKQKKTAHQRKLSPLNRSSPPPPQLATIHSQTLLSGVERLTSQRLLINRSALLPHPYDSMERGSPRGAAASKAAKIINLPDYLEARKQQSATPAPRMLQPLHPATLRHHAYTPGRQNEIQSTKSLSLLEKKRKSEAARSIERLYRQNVGPRLPPLKRKKEHKSPIRLMWDSEKKTLQLDEQSKLQEQLNKPQSYRTSPRPTASLLEFVNKIKFKLEIFQYSTLVHAPYRKLSQNFNQIQSTMLRFLTEVKKEANAREIIRSGKNHNAKLQSRSSAVFDGGFSYGQRTGTGSYLYPNGDYYKGTWVNNQRHSKGICLFQQVGAYLGNWNGDSMEGKGLRLYPDGDIIEGNFVNGCLEICRVRVRYRNGEIYEGRWKSDMRDGKGVHYYSDGDVYEGAWSNDKREGQGRIFFRDQGIYTGQFKNDTAEGTGKYSDKQGNLFVTLKREDIPQDKPEYQIGVDLEQQKKKWSEAMEYEKLRNLLFDQNRRAGPAVAGKFIRAKLNGIGKISYQNGDQYIGEFREGNRSGVGLMVYRNLKGIAGDYDQAVYIGFWKQNQRQGWGRQTWMDGSQFQGEWKKDERVKGSMKMANQDIYSGEWKNDKFHGKGELKVSGGKTFHGTFQNGQSPDYGTIHYKNGDLYVGTVDTPVTFSKQMQARDFVKTGKGRMAYGNGDIYEGDWDEDKRSGKGSLHYANGDYYEGEFMDDMRHGGGKMFYSASKEFYQGDWHLDQRSGKGMLIDGEDEVYVGGWRNDRQEGMGRKKKVNDEKAAYEVLFKNY